MEHLNTVMGMKAASCAIWVHQSFDPTTSSLTLQCVRSGQGVPRMGAAAAPSSHCCKQIIQLPPKQKKSREGGSNKLSTRTRNLMVEMVKWGMGFWDNRCHAIADVNPYSGVWPFTPWGSSPLFPAGSGISGNEKDKEQTSWSCDSPEH